MTCLIALVSLGRNRVPQQENTKTESNVYQVKNIFMIFK